MIPISLSGALLAFAQRWQSSSSAAARLRAARRATRAAERRARAAEQRTAAAEEAASVAQQQAVTAAAELETARGQIEVLTAQIELFAAWEARERERLRSETAMFAARTARAYQDQIAGES